MRITVLTVPDCPNTSVVRERLARALDGPGLALPPELFERIEWVEVSDAAQAAATGMTGSPTVLLDGVDPFAAPDAVPSVSCRLYRGADGAVQGAPDVESLRRALLAWAPSHGVDPT